MEGEHSVSDAGRRVKQYGDASSVMAVAATAGGQG